MSNTVPLTKLIMPEVLSPSTLEMYAQCPYQWYVQKQIKIHDSIQKFEALNLGLIAHASLAKVFSQIKSDNVILTMDNYDYYAAFLNKVFLEVVEEYIQIEYSHSKLSALDINSIERLGQKLQYYLYFEIFSFKKFKPWLIEETISGNYAGYKFSGRVDRVDRFNDLFIVIDYKLGSSDILSFTDPNAQYKFQTSLYALLLERQYGLKCVGTFYIPISVNQYSNNKIGGALDNKYFEEEDIYITSSCFKNLSISNTLMLNDQEINFKSFNDFLLYKEKVSSQLINSMKSAVIKKNSLNPKGEYCPILSACRKCLK